MRHRRLLRRSIVAACSAAIALTMSPVAAQSAAEVRVQTALQEVRLALVRQGQIGANTAAAVLAARSTDIDGDGTLEPPMMRSSAQGPAGGGWLPTGTAGGTLDGYGTEYGYCAFNNGSSRGASTGLLAGDPAGGLLLAVIFAGPDRTFQTSCAGLKAGGVAQGDDYVATMSTAQTNLGAGIHFARPPVANDAALAALAAASSGDLLDGELRLVRDTQTLWRWNASTSAFVRVEMPQVSALQVNGALAASGATSLTGGLSVIGGDVKLNSTGTWPTTIGNADGTVTLTGTKVSINSTGIGNTDIGNASGKTTLSGVTTLAGATYVTGPGLDIQSTVNINTTGINPTVIGNYSGSGSLTTFKGVSTFERPAFFQDSVSVSGTTEINMTGSGGTTIGNAKSTTTFGGPAVFTDSVQASSLAGSTGLRLSGGTGSVQVAGSMAVQDALTVSGATTLQKGLAVSGDTIKLNDSGAQSTVIGSTALGSTTTILGTLSINTVGLRVMTIGNPNTQTEQTFFRSPTVFNAKTEFNQNMSVMGGMTALGLLNLNGSGTGRTIIGTSVSPGSTLTINGATTVNAEATFLSAFTVTGGPIKINTAGPYETTVGNPNSNTIFAGPVFFGFGSTTPSITGVEGLTLSAGSTEGIIAVNGASQFSSLITANGGVATTSLLVNPLANNPPAQVGINTATPAYALDVVGDINASGLVRANGVQLTSDARFKTRIAPLTTALQTLERIEGVAFDWNRAAFPERKFPATRQFGVIAQQVETVLPELVATDARGYKSVNYIGFVPLLIEGMKAQQGQLQQQASKLAGHDKQLASQGLRLDATEARLGKADEALARLAKRADGFERLAQHFSQPADDTLRVEAPRLVASNFTADRIAVETLVAQRLEAEQLKVRKLEADELRVTGDLQARRLVAERVSTGEKELFVSLGTVAPLFEVPEGAHFAVTLSSNDGSYATATVLKAGGALRLVPTSSQGIELVPLGGAVGVMAPSKKVKASWLRTG